MTMADPIIELQELLNRASGPGKISPDSPLETRLYGANGQPIGTAGNPLQVKAQDTDSALGQIKDALETLATQTTLIQVKQALDTLNQGVATSDGQTAIQQAITALAGIVATEQGVGAVASALAALAQVAATESTLSQAVQQLESIVSRLQNTLSVEGEVQLKGRTVEIGGVNYEFDPPRTLYGPAASRPSASDAHAAVPYVVYVSVDTKAIEQTDGTNWQRWGVV